MSIVPYVTMKCYAGVKYTRKTFDAAFMYTNAFSSVPIKSAINLPSANHNEITDHMLNCDSGLCGYLLYSGALGDV